MSATQSQGVSIAFRTPQPDQFPRIASSPVTGVSLPVTFREKADGDMLNRFGEQFRLSGIEISSEEFRELAVFDEFLACHVQPNKVCDVQCMYLWNEWVRTYRRRSRGFPKLILEKEFRSVITDKFGVVIVTDGNRGAVYPGLKFVP
jgi:hypothetical protein